MAKENGFTIHGDMVMQENSGQMWQWTSESPEVDAPRYADAEVQTSTFETFGVDGFGSTRRQQFVDTPSEPRLPFFGGTMSDRIRASMEDSRPIGIDLGFRQSAATASRLGNRSTDGAGRPEPPQSAAGMEHAGIPSAPARINAFLYPVRYHDAVTRPSNFDINDNPWEQ